MGWSLLIFPILCLLFLFFPFPSYFSSLTPLCNLGESSVLLQFKSSFTLDSSASEMCIWSQSSYPKTASWENGTDCCMWDGVICDTLSSHVVGLDLSCSWLYGELHPDSTLFQLSHLQMLNLAFNFFNWSQMPFELGGLVSLTHLNLSYSGFNGEIPLGISHLSKLVSLDLSCNQVALSTRYYDKSLTIRPSIWESFIQNVTNLQHLLLDLVDMSSIKPNSLSMLMNFSSTLVSLGLMHTRLQGTFPNNILQFPNLQHLEISGNQNLGIQLPKSNWSSPIKLLGLSDINLSKQSLDSISHLKSLNFLYLASCGIQESSPQFFLNLTQLTGLSLYENNFNGEILSSVSNLKHLTTLDLSFNNFSGQIPNFFNQLIQLEYLSLAANNFGGPLPSSLFSLTHVKYLDCSKNKLEGILPENISGLSKLTFLDLKNNLLNGTIPFWCFSLPYLKYLYLDSNRFTGNIGDFSSYSLEGIHLSGNMLQNNIPKSISNLINLTHLTLSSNNFSGVLDFHMFSKLNHLLVLDLSKNRFVSLVYEIGVGYTIPSLPNLVLLDLSDNLFHGSIPKWLNGIGNNSLSSLDLSHNLFSSVETLSRHSIRFLDLSFNLLEGNLPIPLAGTTFFSVSNNKLTGHVSSMICNASSLNILNLSHNKLIGIIPQCLGSFPDLSVMDMQMNNFFGTIPGNISETNMFQTLKFNHNQLKGPLPRSLSQCKILEVLDLGDNEIEDIFPNWLESLEKLQVLVLRANHFYGMIANLKSKHPFPQLRIFDVSNNHFSGHLPAIYIQQFRGMMDIDDSRIGLRYMTNNYSTYNDSVLITMKGVSIELTRILVTFTTIDLSNNKFEGEIPEAIGKLNSLKGLNLSHNKITNTIPPSLGNLKSLEWLDLSSNKLIGEIPKALTSLNYLSTLNLSQNQLVGTIPQEKQFGTFSNDTYKGNPGLCGFPLSKGCDSGDGKKQPSSSMFHDDDDEFGFGWKAVAVGYGCGFLFGVLIGYLVLSTGKPQWLVKAVEGWAKEMVRNKKSKASANRGRRN